MASADVQTLFVSVVLKASLYDSLKQIDKDIVSVLTAGLQTYLSTWLNNVTVVGSECSNGDLEFTVGIAWYYVLCTRDFERIVCERVTQYLRDSMFDYAGACGALPSLPEELSVYFIPAGQDVSETSAGVPEGNDSLS
ncbi:ORFC [Mastadenovirus pipistrelli]|uniref:Uncharacterized protein n=1 Tax=Bat mastadenovirus TaxID=740971 RepID=A0A894JKH3_9ADEN|nr:ORFC [Bat mastadenovirus B]QRV11600.1 hypothetical protein [Bat mastadenovirus]